MKKYLVNTEKVRKHTHTHTHTHTQLADKGLNNDLYNYKGGIFPMGETPPLFVRAYISADSRPPERKALKNIG